MNSLFGISEELISAYEDARLEGRQVPLADYLPERNHPQWLMTLQELIRIDMELSQRQGNRVSLEAYRSAWPMLFEDSALLAPLAFEEYRLANQQGITVSPQSYAERYGINVTGWPKLGRSSEHSSGLSSSQGDDVTRGRLMKISAGTRLLDFEIVAPLGEGAFSRVYLARQESLSGRLVVLKFSSRRLKEADKLARLQHTNIVPLYSVHDWNDLSVLCMPWFGSATLRDVLEPGKQGGDSRPNGEMLLSTVKGCDSRLRTQVEGQSAEQAAPANAGNDSIHGASRRGSPLLGLDGELAAVWITQQIAEGLRHAHKRGILHRDLKPANVLLTSDGLPMILDFNLSALQADDATAGGTLPYMSPEQIEALESRERVDERSDIFSLGVLFFELLTGQRPFTDAGLDRRQMVEERRTTDVSPRARNRAVSVDTDSIVRHCLAPQATSRYQSADELLEDLGRQLTSRPLKFAENRSIKERVQKWTRRHPRITSISSVLLMCSAVLTLGTWQYLRVASNLRHSEVQRSAIELLRVAPDVKADAFSAAIGDSDRSKAALQIRETLSEYSFLRSDHDATSPDVTRAKETLMELQRLAETLEGAATGETSPDIPAAPYLQALKLAMNHRFSEAAETLRPIVQKNPELFESTLLLGMLARAQDTSDSAEPLLTAALALRPDDFPARMQRGLGYLKSERFDLATQDFQRALELRANAADTWFALALAQTGAGKLTDALSSYDKAIEHQFPETRIHFAKADLLDQMGRNDEAKAVREAALQLTPADHRSWVARGLARLPGDPELAATEIRKALELNPSSHDAFRNLSMVLSEYLKRPEESISVLDEAIKFHPQDEFLWAGRGVLYARKGDTVKAVADAKQSTALSSDPFLNYMVACIYALTARGEQEEAHRVEALKLIAQSLKKDASLATSMATDPDLGNIQQDPRFQQLISAAQALSPF
ncbi:MAG: protein kinase [Planctomycetaceae bacterium]